MLICGKFSFYLRSLIFDGMLVVFFNWKVKCWPRLKTLYQFIRFFSSCWSFPVSFRIFGHLIDLARFYFLPPSVLFTIFLSQISSWSLILYLYLFLCPFHPKLSPSWLSICKFVFPTQVHLLFGVCDDISDVLGNIILLRDAFSSCRPLIHAEYNPTFSSLSNIHLHLLRCLGRAWRTPQGQTDLFLFLFFVAYFRFPSV